VFFMDFCSQPGHNINLHTHGLILQLQQSSIVSSRYIIIISEGSRGRGMNFVCYKGVRRMQRKQVGWSKASTLSSLHSRLFRSVSHFTIRLRTVWTYTLSSVSFVHYSVVPCGPHLLWCVSADVCATLELSFYLFSFLCKSPFVSYFNPGVE